MTGVQTCALPISSASLNTADYQTCFLWINAVCKADGASVTKLLDLASTLFSENGYEFPVTFTAINARSLIMITNINYERTVQETEKALAFSRHCYAVLIKNGFLPYRSGSGMFEKLPVHTSAVQDIHHKLKMVFDPKQILAPGKYNIG